MLTCVGGVDVPAPDLVPRTRLKWARLVMRGSNPVRCGRSAGDNSTRANPEGSNYYCPQVVGNLVDAAIGRGGCRGHVRVDHAQEENTRGGVEGCGGFAW